MSLLSVAKRTFQKTFWPYGSIAGIARGHLKGYKFVISQNSGWSPVLGRWEPECQEIFVRFIKPGQVVFDLGANNGIHSLLFSKLVGGNGKVYAFEPLPDNIKEIKRNSELNKIGNIEVVPTAVGSYDGEITFLVGLLGKQGSIVGIGRESGQKIAVQLTALRTFVERENVRPDFLKIDIEGAESDALTGFENLIESIQPVFFIELHTPEQDKKVGEILKRYKYSVYRLTDKDVQNDLGVPHLEKIKNLDLTHPHADGIWGTVLALPESYKV